MRHRLTQHEAIFYRLYKAYREAKEKGTENRLIPVHEFMGEIYAEEVALWGYVSYEVGARISEVYADNPGLLYREMLKGKTPGVQYYGYRIIDNPTRDLIKEPKIRALYDKCATFWKHKKMTEAFRAQHPEDAPVARAAAILTA